MRRRRMRPRGRQIVTIACLAVCLLGLTSCLRPAKMNTRCRGNGYANDNGWLVRCAGGRWTWGGISVNQVVQLIGIAQRPAPSISGPPIRVMVTGDSTGQVWGQALARYSAKHPEIVEVRDIAYPGCPITPTIGMRNLPDERMDSAHCSSWQQSLAGDLASFRPEVTIVVESMMEQADQLPEDGSAWRNVLDPEWASFQLGAYERYADILSASGTAILWADVPVMRFSVRTMPWLSEAPERTAALNANYRRLVAERPGVTILPLSSRIDRPFGEIDWFTRPDGIHISQPAADIETADWLIPLLLERFRPTPAPAG